MRVRYNKTGVEYTAEQVTKDTEQHGTLCIPSGGWKLTKSNGEPEKFAPSDKMFKEEFSVVSTSVIESVVDDTPIELADEDDDN